MQYKGKLMCDFNIALLQIAVLYIGRESYSFVIIDFQKQVTQWNKQSASKIETYSFQPLEKFQLSMRQTGNLIYIIAFWSWMKEILKQS